MGIPYAEVLQIYAEAKADLLQLPGAEAVGLGLDGIHVHTTEPDALPKEVGGVPIIAASPYTTPIAGLPYREARGIFARHEATLKQIPGVQEVQLARDGIVVYTEHPDLLPEELEEIPVKALPPLSGGG